MVTRTNSTAFPAALSRPRIWEPTGRLLSCRLENTRNDIAASTGVMETERVPLALLVAVPDCTDPGCAGLKQLRLANEFPGLSVLSEKAPRELTRVRAARETTSESSSTRVVGRSRLIRFGPEDFSKGAA